MTKERGDGARRATFEQLVAETAKRATDRDAVRAALEGQACYQPEPTTEGLDQLSEILAAHFSRPGGEASPAVLELARRYRRQPLPQLYAFAIQREHDDADAAQESLEALRDADPGDPMAEMFALGLAGDPIVAASETVRLANIAKLAATPLLKNPYELAVGAIFESIREREHARVLDIGVGGGAQMVELIRLLGRTEHRVRRLELVGLDFISEFLETAGGNIAQATTSIADRLEIVFEPVPGKIEAIDQATIRRIRGASGLDAANATIALHEVPAEHKLAALANVHELSPSRVVIAEWNYCLENTLSETSTEFVFNVRSVAAAMVAALTESHSLDDARRVVRDWLSQAGCQLICPGAERQECFLDVTSWRALLERTGFEVMSPGAPLLAYGARGHRPRIGDGGWYVETSQYAGGAPIALILAAPQV